MKFIILVISCVSGVIVAHTGSGDCDYKQDYSDYKPHPSDCSLFFQCTPNGTYVLFTCPHNLQFDSSLNVCVHPNSANCSIESITSTSDPSLGEPTVTDTESTTTSSEKCKVGEYFPHETDCEAFYLCISGKLITVYCPAGTQFNATSHECGILEIECHDRSPESPETTIAVSTTEASTDTFSEREFSSITAETETTETTSEASTEALTETSTKDSTETLSEDSTEDSTDASVESSTKVSTESSTETLEISTNDPIEVSTIASLETATESTTQACTNDEIWPIEGNCTSFYRCFGGVAHVVTCPYGKHYNSKTQQCNEPEEAGCDLEIDQFIDIFTENPEDAIKVPEIFTETLEDSSVENLLESSIQTCSSNEHLPDESNCEAFYSCINGKFIKLFCPSGRHYNSNNRQCNEKEVAGCENNAETCVDYELRGDETDCDVFYFCINGKFMKLFCPSGKHYNVRNQECNEPALAGCASNVF